MRTKELKMIGSSAGNCIITKTTNGLYEVIYYFQIDKNKNISNLDTKLAVSYDVNTSILNKREKKYLKTVIKPFRDKVKYIVKIDWYNSGEKKEFIAIQIENDSTINLPFFKKNEMYKNMEVGRKYTLKELEL